MWQYVGAGSSVNGVPARDLTDDEWNAIPKWLRDIALDRGYYKNITVSAPVDVEVVVTEPAQTDDTPATQPPLDDAPTKKGRKAAK